MAIVINLKWLVNYRPKLVYHPHILAEMSGHLDGTEESKRRAENLVGIINYWKSYNSESGEAESSTPPA